MLVNNQHYRTIWPTFQHEVSYVEIIDQTKLPHEFAIQKITSLEQMIAAINSMQVRGAPLIGAAAAYGMALAVLKNATDEFLQLAAQQLIASRPTAVNLKWAANRMLHHMTGLPLSERLQAAWSEAARICDEDVEMNQAIGRHGLALIEAMQHEKKRRVNILTHCNAGWLATVDMGTALAPIYAAHNAGVAVHVWVDETRPRNQGASLTAWELEQHGVPCTVISDNAGGHLMQHGQVDMVIVGADRVTATGDVCNKVGTYLKALAAADAYHLGHDIPFYAAVPSPTIDWEMHDGVTQIAIEERHPDELAFMSGRLANGEVARVNILPAGVQVANPAFDVTPARLVTGIITERGVFAPDGLIQMQHIHG